ncbi:gamma-parvin isoform X1 [Equus quagga]|uniref:gamma-parvin isoform X1 n=1 Tax=Equus quagga TaxID=89248 RepID=UPI001EE289CA|nr:gamma-parvin isoform X1 [Equus quagga]
MEAESLYNLLQLPQAGPPVEEELPQGQKRKYVPPTSRKDPKFEELQKVLMEWINTELFPEHIVVRNLEEDMFDGLILHHLFQKLAGLKLEVEEIALTEASQRRKLALVLEAANRSLQVEEQQARWSMEAIFSKDLLATLHLLVALARRFQPALPLPTNVQVEVITMERTKSGLKSEKSVEQLTECSTEQDQSKIRRRRHPAPADRTTARLLPALEGILPHSQLSCGNEGETKALRGCGTCRGPLSCSVADPTPGRAFWSPACCSSSCTMGMPSSVGVLSTLPGGRVLLRVGGCIGKDQDELTILPWLSILTWSDSPPGVTSTRKPSLTPRLGDPLTTAFPTGGGLLDA